MTITPVQQNILGKGFGSFPVSTGEVGPAILEGFRITVNTALPGSASDTVEIPVAVGVQDYSIDWGDGHVIDYTTGGIKTHTYTMPGVFNIELFGNTCFGLNYGFAFDTSNDRQKITGLSQWGTDLSWLSLNSAFTNCTNLSISATDIPDWTAVTDSSFAFALCGSITSVAGNLPTGNIDTFQFTWFGTGITTFPVLDFSSATSFISTWQQNISLTSFPSQSMPLVETLELAFFDCTSLTSWGAPIGATPVLTSLLNTYGNCALASYPSWDTSTILTCAGTWVLCNFGEFPLLDLSNCTDFEGSWFGCGFLGFLGEKFPQIDFSSGTNFMETWKNAANVKFDFVPDFRSMTDGSNCFQNATGVFDCETYSLLLIDLDNNNTNLGVSFHAGGNSSNTALSEVSKDNLEARIPPWIITDANSACSLLWLDDGSGGIDEPWNDNLIWMD